MTGETSAGRDAGRQYELDPTLPIEVAYLQGLAEHGDDPEFVRAAIRAQQEHGRSAIQGQAFAAAGPSPDFTERDFHIVCDVDGDGHRDFVANEFAGGRSRLRATSGGNGSVLWWAENLQTADHPVAEYERRGANPPKLADNAQPSLDGNGDGVCDILAYGYYSDGISTPVTGSPSIGNYTGVIRLLDGRTGEPIWTKPVYADEYDVRLLRVFFNIPVFRERVLLNFPTGFLAYESPSGPRVAFKTTDLYYTMTRAPFDIPTRFQTETTAVVEHVYVFDALTGKQLWKRDLGAGPNSRWSEFSWITGVADLQGDGEPEIVLDQYRLENPRATEAKTDFLPLLNRTLPEPPYRFGRAMSVLALRGENGATSWNTEIYRDGKARAQLPLEEGFEVLMWTHAQIVDDITGDGQPDAVALYLTRDANGRNQVNGRFVTHVHPVDGAAGRKVFGDKDVKIQGWGFAASLGTPNGSAPLLAVGTVDVPVDSKPLARFPQKEVRLTVLDASDGTARWSYEGRFAQDDYLSYGLTLEQYARRLAPHDWNGDGVLDVVTPSQYRGPGAVQMLLSTMNHTYQILDGQDGKVLHTLTSWGANGAVIDCVGDGDNLTILSGHSRRLDLARIQPDGDRTVWRAHVWVDPTLPRAASAGFDLLHLSGKCAHDADGKTYYAINAALVSRQRGREVLPILGVLDASGDVQWQRPHRELSEPLVNLLDAVPTKDDGLGAGLLALMGLGPLIPGALVGAAIAIKAPRGFLFSVTLVLLTFGTFLAPAISGAPIVPAAAPTLPELGSALPDEPARNPPATPGTPLRTHQDLVRAAAKDLAASGIAMPSADDTGSFDENLSISFTQAAGDANGDGTDDVLVDTYCVDWDCFFYPGLEDPVAYTEYFLDSWTCVSGHVVSIRSGTDGASLWNRSLAEADRSYPAGCIQHFVIGIVPTTPGNQGVLVYRYATTDAAWPSELVKKITHTFYMLDVKDGRTLWSRTFEGRYSETFFLPQMTVVEADTFLIHPILQVPPRNPHPAIHPETVPALLLQGVGFHKVYVNSTVPDPVLLESRVRFTEAQQPDEWAARLDLATGQVLWRQATFTPDPYRSVKPVAVRWHHAEPAWTAPRNVASNYWQGETCCFDVNGDKVPDLVFYTYEWTSMPTTNMRGPYFRDSNLVAFDGANGRRLYTSSLFNDSKGDIEEVQPQLLGDVNGDGAPDLLVHIIQREYTFNHQLSVRSGRDGSELWKLDGPREKRVWVLGDANQDGANDFVVLAWFHHPSLSRWVDGPATNVTATPLQVRSGRDGSLLWQTETVTAPVDVIAMYRQFQVNGFPDLDGDGVGDLVIDDPRYLPDLTVIHKQRILSGRDGSMLLQYVSGGTFSFPVAVGDITGDGREDLGLLNGDLVDLWFTTYDGAAQTALWSRRVLQSPVSEFVNAEPLMRVDRQRVNNGSQTDLIVNFHIDITSRIHSTIIYISTDGVSEGDGFVMRSTYPSFARIHGEDGSMEWSYPNVYDPLLNVTHAGPTWASRIYAQAIALEEAPPKADPQTVRVTLATMLAAGSFLAAAIAGFLTTRRLRA